MKLELLDAYNIRARLSASIILLAPIAITLFLCFEELRSLASCSVILFVLLALTNYVPIMQRRFHKKKVSQINYAAMMLLPSDTTFDESTKSRYHKKLASLDDSFLPFIAPDDSEKFHDCCESAVLYLRSRTREERLVQEENINYGFCKNLIANKPAGIIICTLFAVFTAIYSIIAYDGLSSIPLGNYFAFISDAFLLLFWIIGINENVLESSAVHYAKALIMAVDTLKKEE